MLSRVFLAGRIPRARCVNKSRRGGRTEEEGRGRLWKGTSRAATHDSTTHDATRRGGIVCVRSIGSLASGAVPSCVELARRVADRWNFRREEASAIDRAPRTLRGEKLAEAPS